MSFNVVGVDKSEMEDGYTDKIVAILVNSYDVVEDNPATEFGHPDDKAELAIDCKEIHNE